MTIQEFKNLYPDLLKHVKGDFDRISVRVEDFPEKHLTCSEGSTDQYYFRYLVSYRILDIVIFELRPPNKTLVEFVTYGQFDKSLVQGQDAYAFCSYDVAKTSLGYVLSRENEQVMLLTPDDLLIKISDTDWAVFTKHTI